MIRPLRHAMPHSASPRRQSGAVTLLIGLLLLTAAALLTVTVARTGVMELRIANNELRAGEAQQAAEAGLQYALAWLAEHDCLDFDATFATPGVPPPVRMTGAADPMAGYVYDLRVSRESGSPCHPDTQVLCVQSSATTASAAHLQARVRACVRQTRLLAHPNGGGPPPLIVNGCLGGNGPGAAVTPRACPEAEPGCARPAVVSSAPPECVDTDGLEAHDGTVAAAAFTGSAWDWVFAVTPAQFQTLAARHPETFRWITDPAPWYESLGRPEAPVVLVFAAPAGCPPVSGSPTIHGIVYFEQACGASGWGGAVVQGAVVFEGALEQLAAYSAIRHWHHAGPIPGVLNPVLSARLIPGTWRDW